MKAFLDTVSSVHPQSNTFPERGVVYDFCYEKKGSGQWIDWMDTIPRESLKIGADIKVLQVLAGSASLL